MSKRQRTLAAFGFTKNVLHNNNLVEVKLPKTVHFVRSFLLRKKASLCMRSFVSKTQMK